MHLVVVRLIANFIHNILVCHSTTQPTEYPRINVQTLQEQKLEFLGGLHFVAESTGNLFISHIWLRKPQLNCTAQNHNLTQNGHSRSLEIIHFRMNESQHETAYN